MAHAVFPEMSIRENLTVPRLGVFRRLLGWLDRRAERDETRTWIGRLDVRPPEPERYMSLLSGGNQQKVILARWLRNDPDVLLLEEPTQGVDVGVKDTIYALISAIAAEGRAVVIISSDTKEVALVSDRVIVMNEGFVAATLDGDNVTESRVLSASLGIASQASSIRPDLEEHSHV